MHVLQRRRFEMLNRVAGFINQYGDLFPEHSVAREAANQILSILQGLNERAQDQTVGIGDARVETKQKTEARQALRLAILRIVRTGRLISQTIPQFEQQFKLPGSKSDAALVQIAREIVEKASKVYDVFIHHAMPPDFIDDLKANIDKVEHARHSRAAARATHRNATAAIDGSFQKAMSTLARLDILMDNILQDDPTMAFWKSARHVAYPRKEKAAAAAAQSNPSSDSPSN